MVGVARPGKGCNRVVEGGGYSPPTDCADGAQPATHLPNCVLTSLPTYLLAGGAQPATHLPNCVLTSLPTYLQAAPNQPPTYRTVY